MTAPTITKEDEFSHAHGTNFKFKRLSSYTPGEAWIKLIYAGTKAGKTFYAGGSGRALFLNIGDGMETLLHPAFTNKYPKAKDEVIVVDIRERNPQGIAEAFEMVLEVINHAFNKLENQFDVVVLDEVTAFRRIVINKAMTLNTRQGGRKLSTIDFVKKEIDDYNIEMQMIEWFLGKMVPFFKERGKHFIMLAHERQIYGKPAKIGDEAPLIKVVPGFTGKTFPDQITAFFDDVWRMEVVGSGSNRVYRAITAGSERSPAGSRHGGVFDVAIQNPDFKTNLAKIKQSYRKP